MKSFLIQMIYMAVSTGFLLWEIQKMKLPVAGEDRKKKHGAVKKYENEVKSNNQFQVGD